MRRPVPRLLIPAAALILIHCGRVGRLESGKYEVADQEYSSENYVMERRFDPKGTFEEKHIIDHCLIMEMHGAWDQEGGRLTLAYAEMRNRGSCRDTLPSFAKDSAKLEIPLRNVDGSSFESYLAASDGKQDKWIKWLKVN